jgi:hypothetical protein
MNNSLLQNYPRTIKKSKWIDYLGRDLVPFEKNILFEVMFEKKFNKRMIKLYENCIKHDYYVPMLTNLDGNCLFECLVHHNIGNNIEDIRNALAYIMYQYKDYKGFFDGRDDTLKELYDLTNEIEYVYCKKDNKLYKYTYDVMCQDIATLSSWGNLPTELILLVLSRLFDLQFEITTNRFEKLTCRDAFDMVKDKSLLNLRKIRLGHIFENHYVPLDKLEQGEELVPLFYNYAKIKFHKWGRVMAKLKYQSFLSELTGKDFSDKSDDDKDNTKEKKTKKTNQLLSTDRFIDMTDYD